MTFWSNTLKQEMKTMFEVRKFNFEDYPKYAEWLSVRDRPVPRSEHLAKEGFIAFDDNDDYIVAFLFSANDKICSFGNFASNPYADKQKRAESVEFLVDYMIEIAKERHFEMAFINTNRSVFVNRLLKKQFKVYDSNLTQLGRVL